MSHEMLDYRSPPTEPASRWRSGDTIYVGGAMTYAAVDVGLIRLCASGMLGPSLDLVLMLLLVSALGVVAAFPIQLFVRRKGVTWRSAVAVLVCFVALTCFNGWVFYEATMAV